MQRSGQTSPVAWPSPTSAAIRSISGAPSSRFEGHRQAPLPAPAPTRRDGSNARADRASRIRAACDGGPAQATISAIAARAGVERHTVYRHFPDIVALIRACTQHGMEVTDLPHPNRWSSFPDPLGRLRAALEAMYAYHHANERLIGNILRDLPVMPELAAGSSDYHDRMGEIWGSVLAPWMGVHGARGRRTRALVSAALEFGTWQAMTVRGGLTDADATATMVAAVEAAQTR